MSLYFFGNGDLFQLLSKASSEKEGWMKSTKAMDTENGCVIQVTTQQRNPDGSSAIAEALTFVPNIGIFRSEAQAQQISQKKSNLNIFLQNCVTFSYIIYVKEATAGKNGKNRCVIQRIYQLQNISVWCSAPLDAIYEKSDGSWAVASEITREDLRIQITGGAS